MFTQSSSPVVSTFCQSMELISQFQHFIRFLAKPTVCLDIYVTLELFLTLDESLVYISWKWACFYCCDTIKHFDWVLMSNRYIVNQRKIHFSLITLSYKTSFPNFIFKTFLLDTQNKSFWNAYSLRVWASLKFLPKILNFWDHKVV